MLHRLPALAAAGGVALAGALAPLPAAAQQAKDTLTIGLSQFPSNLHPNIDSMLSKSWVLYTSHRPLTTFDPEWNLICVLCEELPDLAKGTAEEFTTAEGKRSIRATFKLREGLKWGDGTPVTSKDAVFTWQAGKDPKTGFANNDLYVRRITNVIVKDDRTFTIERDQFACDYQNMSDYRLLPAHIEEPIYKADPDNYKSKTAYDTQTTNAALYNGPFRIAALERGSSITLEANPHWTGDKPRFKRVVVRAIESQPALEANLLSGDIDYIAGELGLTLDQMLGLQKRLPSKYNYTYRPGLIYEHIDLKLENPHLQDIRVRRALLLAVDREGLTKELFEGKQPVAHSSVNPIDKNFDPNVPKYAYDPAQAKKLLDEAGWKPGRDGIRVNAKGERLSLEFGTTSGNTTRELVQQALQAQWKDVGVEVVIKNEPARVFFGQTMRERKFTGLAMYAWSSSPESPPRTTLHSTQIPTQENGWGGQNYMGYKSERMDKVLDGLVDTCPPGNPAPRKQLWADLQKVYAEDLPVLPLYFRVDPFAIPQLVSTIKPTGHQYSSTMWMQEWGPTGAK